MASAAAPARIAPDALSVRRKSSVIRLAMPPVSMVIAPSLSYPTRQPEEARGATHATDQAPLRAAERRRAERRAGRSAEGLPPRAGAEHLPHPGARAEGAEPVQRLGRL